MTGSVSHEQSSDGSHHIKITRSATVDELQSAIELIQSIQKNKQMEQASLVVTESILNAFDVNLSNSDALLALERTDCNADLAIHYVGNKLKKVVHELKQDYEFECDISIAYHALSHRNWDVHRAVNRVVERHDLYLHVNDSDFYATW